MEELYKHGLLWQDHQHTQLLECIASLNRARGTELELNEHKAAMVFLEFYVKTHFDLEIYYMEVLGYPEMDSHKMAHQEFSRMVDSLPADLKTTKDSSVLVTELCNWFKDHILKTDKKLAEFIKSQVKG